MPAGGFLGGFLGGEGTNPLDELRTRIQARVTEARAKMDEVRARFQGTNDTNSTATQRGLMGQGKLMAQFPRLAKFKRKGGLIGNLGVGKRLMNQNVRPPGYRHQNISPTAQVPALAEDVYADKLRAESSPGLSVSL